MIADEVKYEGLEYPISIDMEAKSEICIRAPEACCDNPSIIISRGIYVCENCGVVKGPIFTNMGPRTFSAEDIEKKKMNEPNYGDMGYRTLISNPNVDYYGYPLKAKARARYYRLAKIQKSITNSYERNILVGGAKFSQITSSLGLTRQAIQEANNVYKKVLEKKLTTGRSIDQLVAACVYIAIRLLDLPRTLEEVSEAAQISEKKIGRNYRLILCELKINLRPQKIPPFISRFGDELKIPSKYQVEAIQLFDKAKDQGLIVRGDPKSYAGAAIYIVMKKHKEIKVNQKEIAEISFISDVTLRKKMNQIKKMAGS